jgi:hypothetical protein
MTDLVDASARCGCDSTTRTRRAGTCTASLDDTIDISQDFFDRGHRERIEALLAAMVITAPSVTANVQRPLGQMILGMADVGLYGRRDN